MAEKIVHPGKILLENYLKTNQLSATALAIELRVTPARINDIVRGRRAITPDTAVRLAKFFGNSPFFWLDLQNQFDVKQLDSKDINNIIPLTATQQRN